MGHGISTRFLVSNWGFFPKYPNEIIHWAELLPPEDRSCPNRHPFDERRCHGSAKESVFGVCGGDISSTSYPKFDMEAIYI